MKTLFHVQINWIDKTVPPLNIAESVVMTFESDHTRTQWLNHSISLEDQFITGERWTTQLMEDKDLMRDVEEHFDLLVTDRVDELAVRAHDGEEG